MAAKPGEKEREFTQGGLGRAGFVPRPCLGGMPKPVNMGFVQHQAGTDPAAGRSNTRGLNSTFPPALQLLMAL